jgi:hypothetical protein
MTAKFDCAGFKIEGEVEVVKQIVNLIAPNTSPSGRYQYPNRKEGEKYAGIILDEETGLPSHHLILLPGEAKDLNWPQAQEWAKEQGGELPLRREQSLLFVNLKKHFERRWHWSAEQESNYYAWAQSFMHGTQDDLRKDDYVRVRAIRREYI